MAAGNHPLRRGQLRGHLGRAALRRVAHAVCRDDADAGFVQHAFAFFDVCAFEPRDNRNRNAEVFRRRDDAVRAIDRWLYTRVDFEDEIKAGNVAAAIYKSALLLFVAVVVATMMS